MTVKLIVVEVQPGLLLRMTAAEAARYGYEEQPKHHKAVRPTGKKRKPVEIVTEDEDGTSDND